MEASDGAAAPGSATGTTSATTTGETTTGASNKGEKEGSHTGIPDVPARSLGLFEEEDARDPNMWKKYAWKYIGALVLFLGAYETLNWYTRKVEEENKRRREENNEQTTNETSSSTSTSNEQNTHQGNITQAAANSSSHTDSVDDYLAKMSEHAAQSMTIASSELDELYAYRRELEAQLQTAGADNSVELKEELEAVIEEIEMFERKKSSTNK